MENGGAWDSNLLIAHLTRGQELAKQLEVVLHQCPPPEQWQLLVQGIQSTLDNAISVAKSSSDSGGAPAAGTDSPRSVSGSPRSENSDRVLKDQERREMCKKRKTLPKWTNQVRVCSGGTGLEAPPDDGFSWRKYGQKDILGAKYPRGYYRCTHRNAKGCPATKQVQRSDENPSIFDITYRGNHTCFQRGSSSSPAPAPAEQEPLAVGDGSPNNRSSAENPFLLSFKAGLTVKTEGLDDHDHQLVSPPFSFPPTPASCVNTGKAHIFSSPSSATLDNQFMGSFSPPFISPTASGSSYFPMPPCQVSGGLGAGLSFLKMESDLAEIVSAAASATSSPVVDLDFVLNAEFDPDFPFDASFFS